MALDQSIASKSNFELLELVGEGRSGKVYKGDTNTCSSWHAFTLPQTSRTVESHLVAPLVPPHSPTYAHQRPVCH
jgi:hypothetical protein